MKIILLLAGMFLFGNASGQIWKEYADSALNLVKKNKVDEAITCYKKITDMLEKDSMWTATNARYIDIIGFLYFYISHHETSLPYFLKAKEIREKVLGKDHNFYIQSCFGVAGTYMRLGDYNNSELNFLEAKNISKRVFGSKHSNYASSCHRLASLYVMMGQFEKAEINFLEAFEIYEQINGVGSSKNFFLYGLLGNLYLNMGRLNEAEQKYYQVKELWKKQDDIDKISSLGFAYQNLGHFYLSIDQFDKAEIMIDSATLLFKMDTTFRPSYGSLYRDLGYISKHKGRFNTAEEFFSKAKAYLKESVGVKSNDYANGCADLAELYWSVNDYKEAEMQLKEAAGVYAFQKRSFVQFASEAEKEIYYSFFANATSALLSLATVYKSDSLCGFIYDFILQNNYLILSSAKNLRKNILETGDFAVRNKYNEWINTKITLGNWLSKPIAERKNFDKELEAKADSLEKGLIRYSQRLYDQITMNDNTTYQKIRDHLKANEIAIEFVDFPFFDGKRFTDSVYYVAWIIRKDKPEPELIYLFEEKQLDSILKIKKERYDLTIDAIYSSPDLYRLVWQPLQKYLDNISKVYYASSGLLHKINFSAIQIGNEKVTADRYQLIQLNTTASVVELTDHYISASDKLIMYGGVNFNADTTEMKSAARSYQLNGENGYAFRGFDFGADPLPELPMTEVEVDNIAAEATAKNYSVITFKGVKANEESIKNLNGNRSPALLHFATHGKFFEQKSVTKPGSSFAGGKIFAQSDNPLVRSMLLMAGSNNIWTGKTIWGIEDGVLTAYEVSNMYLPNTKLVVLSACETGLGNIQGSEGVYGLQRAFKIAGVESLVMSLWSIPDNTTAEFMQIFYHNLFEKKSISEAFHLAQTDMRNKYTTQPHKWAGLILVQ